MYYAQHILLSPNKSLRAWLYNAVRADLLGEKVRIPDIELNYDPSITYRKRPKQFSLLRLFVEICSWLKKYSLL